MESAQQGQRRHDPPAQAEGMAEEPSASGTAATRMAAGSTDATMRGPAAGGAAGAAGFVAETAPDKTAPSAAAAQAAAGAAPEAAPDPTSGNPADQPRKSGGIGKLLAFAGPRKALTYLGCALSAISMLLSFGPYVCIWLVARDLIAVAPNWSQAANLALYGWVALAFAAGSIVVYFAALMCTHLAAFRCAANMRKQTTEHLMHASLGYFDTHASGALRRVVDGCAAETEGLLAHKLPDTAGSVAMILGMLALFFVFDWRLGLACLASVIISIACMFYMMGGRGMDFMMKYQESLVKMNKTGTEYVRGIPVVKVFQQTVHSFRAFYDAIQEFSQMAQDYAVKWCKIPQSLSLTVINGMALFLVPVAVILLPGEADPASFAANFAFYAIFSAVIPTAMTRVMFISEAAQVAQDALMRVSDVLAAPVISAPEKPQVPADNSVAFDDVVFSYEGAAAPALDHVSFEVPAGSTVALVGPSGGGKTTAASLVPRFWDAGSGAVRVGGVDVRDIDPHDLMDHVAFVFQANRLFKQSVLDNVRAARPDATREEALAALSAAQCDDIVEKLPQGVDTVVGAEGVYLSGGEVQRLMIARAICKNAPIVVLDEATAFADPENEVLIQQAFSRLAQGKTVLMIAHRLSTVRRADKIVVFDAGHVAEQGTHDQLVEAGGLYARMWADYEQSVSWKIQAKPAEEAACGSPATADAAGDSPAQPSANTSPTSSPGQPDATPDQAQPSEEAM